MGNVVPIPLPRYATNDFELRDYIIPKVILSRFFPFILKKFRFNIQGAVLFYNLYPMYNNKSYWKDPENFRPERFLNECGAIDQLRTERILNTVFGVGNLT